RRVRVEADTGRPQRPGGPRQKALQQSPHAVHFVRGDLAAWRIGPGGFTFVMARDLHALAEVGEAVEETARFIFPDMNGAPLRLKRFAVVRRLKPEKNLPLDAKRKFKIGQQRLNPGAGGQNQTVRSEFILRR